MQIQTHNMLNIEIEINKGFVYVLLVFILIVSTGCHIREKGNIESEATAQAVIKRLPTIMGKRLVK